MTLQKPLLNSTKKAFMARGLDSKKADDLIKKGLNLNKLKRKSEKLLKSLGLDDIFIYNLLNEARPPIPNDTLTKLLFENRFQCCICRDPSLPIIVHHIVEWSKSKSHEIDNLAVLCHNHHDMAHSKKDISKNLDIKTLKAFKKKWEQEVKDFDTRAILDRMRLEYSNWDYINEIRLFRLAEDIGIEFNTLRCYQYAQQCNIIQKNGYPLPIPNPDKLTYKYEGADCMVRYAYMSDLLHKVIEKITIINISDHLDKGTLYPSLIIGDFIFVQGAHIFSPQTKTNKGSTQLCNGLRRANKVEVRFVFDRWEATSCSAKYDRLLGRRDEGSIIRVEDLSRENGVLIVKGSVLAIGHHFSESLKKREYSPYQ